jgi:hypothetical protein
MRKILVALIAFFLLVFIGSMIVVLTLVIDTGRANHQKADAIYHTLQNIHTIYHAEREYYINHEFLGFPCTFTTLVAKPDQLLDDKFDSGHVDGYTFTFSHCKHEENIGFNGNLTYHLTAMPDPGGAISLPTFCVDDNVDSIPRGEVVFDNPPIITAPPGSSACTRPLP